MKKLILLLGVISATAFAATPGKPALNQMPPEPTSLEVVHHSTKDMTPEMKKEEERHHKEMEKKKHEIEKETSKTNPDWKKVHQLNKEVGDQYADHNTKMMQMKHSIN